MLSRVKIQNFKSIGEPGVDLELKPLTFLVGPNGGGKSSILEGIAVAAQDSFEGRLVRFPSWREIIRNSSSEAVIDVYYAQVDLPDVRLGRRTRLSRENNNTAISRLANDGETPNRSFVEIVERFTHERFTPHSFLISATRGHVTFTAGTGEDPQWVGARGQSLVPLLAIIFGRRAYERQAADIVRWAIRFGLGDIKAGLWSSNVVGADYVDREAETSLNLGLSSSGAKQILTIITQLFRAPKGSLLMIEEPEISLHPKAQIDVLEMFAEAIKEDKQIIATTHSLFMMQGIGYAVHKGWLEPDQVAVYHVDKKKGTGTTSKRLPLSEKGYIKGWVPSFAKVEGQLLREWTKTLPEE